MGAERIDDGGARDDLRFDIGRDLLCTADARGYFISLNAAWENVLGWSREELTGRPFIEFVHPDDVERTLAESAKVTQPAREFGRHTVAEGVEDRQTLLLMGEYGVDYAQGFLIGRPRPVAAGAAPPG